MLTMARTSLLSYLSPLRLAGPVFDKELRVASRQRKSYILRFAYVGLLACFVVGVWFSFAPSGRVGSAVYQASRMGTAGKYIAVTIVWFQYVAAQVLALVLLGNAIAGGLLLIVMLLATSLPLLAIVRVLGGVTWDYVVSGVCITFAATVFTGALSLFPSALYRQSRWGMVQGVWYCILAQVFDVLIEMPAHFYPAFAVLGKLVQLINPTDVLLTRTREMLAARPSTGMPWWPVHCLILLVGSCVILLLVARRVHALAAGAGPGHVQEGRMYRLGMWVGRRGARTKGPLDRRPECATPIRRVQGSPIVWKELRKFTQVRSSHPFLRLGLSTAGVLLLCVGVLFGVVVMMGSSRWVAAIQSFLTSWAVGLPIGLLVGFAITAAGAIAKEREARTLPILLTIALDDSEIIKDKAVGTLRAALLVLLPLSAPLFFLPVFSIVSPIKVNWLAILWGVVLCLVSLLGLTSFFLGLGLYCSARLKTVAGATVCTSAGLVGLLLVGCPTVISAGRRAFAGGSQMWLTASIFVVFGAFAVAGIGLLLLRAASYRLRRNVF